jgi:hypothetical protein
MTEQHERASLVVGVEQRGYQVHVRRDEGVSKVRRDESQVQRVLDTLGRGDVDVGVIVIAEGNNLQLLLRSAKCTQSGKIFRQYARWKGPRTELLHRETSSANHPANEHHRPRELTVSAPCPPDSPTSAANVCPRQWLSIVLTTTPPDLGTCQKKGVSRPTT